MAYPDLKIEYKNKVYSFEQINGQLLLKDIASGTVLSKMHAQKLYQQMALEPDVKVTRCIK